jgi:zinc D-Ala-D-Ala dipeptidase
MKRSFNSVALALLVIACATAPAIPTNRYGLRVVPDLATYQRLAASDPDQRLVDLQSFIPGVVIDIRYATTNNFMHPIAPAETTQGRRPRRWPIARNSRT